MRTLTKTYRVSLRLDTEADADIIAWLETLPSGRRSAGLRKALRAGIQMRAESADNGLAEERLRKVLSEELAKLLTGTALSSPQMQTAMRDHNVVEMEFGEKLDRLLRKF